jgi:tRNA(Leu) C34 or U34 (ribose-2'-O)-methylase TrmL
MREWYHWENPADLSVKIPMLGKNDSLNVSVSAAIMLYEAVRQRCFRNLILKIFLCTRSRLA